MVPLLSAKKYPLIQSLGSTVQGCVKILFGNNPWDTAASSSRRLVGGGATCTLATGLETRTPCSAPYLTLRNVGFPGVVGGVGSSGELVAGAMAFSRGPAGVAVEPVLAPASNDMP